MSSQPFESRIALVTGGASGIGPCSARRFAAGGAASAIAWLCSDEAPIVTGINIAVDGGWSAR